MTELATFFSEAAKKMRKAEFEAFGRLSLSVTCECNEDDHVHTT